MGLFDIFKKDRGYDIHSLEFCEVGKDGKRETLPSLKHYTDSRYIMPVVKMTSRIDRTVKMKVRITEPGGKVHMYDFDAPLKPGENMSAQFPWWGSENRDYFTTVGTWQFDVLDEDDRVVIGAPLEIASLDSLWEEKGWIQLVSGFEFCNTHNDYTIIDHWGTREFMEPEYIGMRCKYMSFSKVEREVTYDVRIENLATGKVKAFSHTVTLKPQGGWLQMCGWGSQSGTSYSPGSYIYTLSYKGKRLASGRFEVAKSPRQRGWIEPEALVLYFYNTDDELRKWQLQSASTIVVGKPVEQQSFKGDSYTSLIAGFQWKSLEGNHPLKLTFKFYYNGNLLYTWVSNGETIGRSLQKIMYSGVIYRTSSSTFPAGCYQVKVYLETQELAEHFVMERTIDVY